MRSEDIVGDKVIGLLGPRELAGPSRDTAPKWLEDAIEEASRAALGRLRTSKLRGNRAVRAWLEALFQQSLWSGPVVSSRAATAMWGRESLVRALPRYRLGDLVVMRDGKPLDLAPLGKPSARLGKNAGVVLRELEKPNTGLRLQSVQLYHPSVKTFAGELAKILASPVNVNGYAGLSRGTIFPEHWDAHDVALLQTHGTKAWRVRAPSLPMPITCHRPVLRPRPKAKRTTVHLRPGAMLYMPRGSWHVGAGDGSIHLTFGLPEDTVALRIADVALKTIGRQVRELAYRAPMFMFDPRSSQGRVALENCFQAYLDVLRPALLDAATMRERPAFFGRRFF